MGRDYYVFSNGRLSRKDNTIYFEQCDGKKKALPIVDIERLHLFGEIDINTKLLNYISQYNILVNIYNYYGYYSGSYASRKKNISGFVTVYQASAYLDEQKRLKIAKSLIDSAIHNILRQLRRRKESSLDFILKIESERNAANASANITQLMGAEGRARKIYYESFNSFLKEDYKFVKRTKQPPLDPLNCLISFGNGLMYSTVLSEIYKTPLDPSISFLHEPSTKRFSLSLDLAEIFKPIIIDSIIFKLINKNIINYNDFDFTDNMCFLNETGKKKFVKEFESKLSTTIKHRSLKRSVSYRTLIKLECYKLIKHLVENEEYKPLKAWW